MSTTKETKGHEDPFDGHGNCIAKWPHLYDGCVIKSPGSAWLDMDGDLAPAGLIPIEMFDCVFTRAKHPQCQGVCHKCHKIVDHWAILSWCKVPQYQGASVCMDCVEDLNNEAGIHDE